MGLTKKEFDVLSALKADASSAAEPLASKAGLTPEAMKAELGRLEGRGFVSGLSLTKEGEAALSPYRVENAVIMAAGLSSRFVPLSYERPKGLLRVRGEVLIERQIRQLREAGIDDITVVVGYMKEAFFYLEDKLGVRIAVNPDYATRNNNSTLMLVREHLGNTYVCSSDDYFVENPFEPYAYGAYYAASYFDGPTDEYCLTCDDSGRITQVSVGGADSWSMLGHVYFDREFSARFKSILEAEYDRPATAGKLWEDIYIEHLGELDMALRPYEKGLVYEFDSLAELTAFDTDFLENVDSRILDNICATLGCEREGIDEIAPIKEGLTNLSFRFRVAGKRYVYRHPGAGTDEVISRASEAFSQGVALNLGIDRTFVHEDEAEGWKISRYVDGCVAFDYHNPAHVEKAMGMARLLHGCGEKSEWDFDVFEKAREIEGLLKARSYPLDGAFFELGDAVAKVASFARADAGDPVLSHNDFYAPNFLVHGDEMDLIDWAYSAMADYASDLGTFVCCSDYEPEEVDEVLATYFQRKPTAVERAHCLAYVAISGWYWFVWALYKEASGDPVGEWLYLWHKYAKTYAKLAAEAYEGL